MMDEMSFIFFEGGDGEGEGEGGRGDFACFVGFESFNVILLLSSHQFFINHDIKI